MIFPNVFEWEDFLSDDEYLMVMREARKARYTTKGVWLGLDSAERVSNDVMDLVMTRISDRLGIYTHVKGNSFYRLAVEGDPSTVFKGIHNDINEGMYDRNKMSLILYLQCDHPDEKMNFYRSTEMGTFSPRRTQIESINTIGDGWKAYQSVSIKSNKLIMFSSALFHGTTVLEGYGKNVLDGRLILPIFFQIGHNENFHVEPEPGIISL